jgi:hypothetical protein
MNDTKVFERYEIEKIESPEFKNFLINNQFLKIISFFGNKIINKIQIVI